MKREEKQDARGYERTPSRKRTQDVRRRVRFSETSEPRRGVRRHHGATFSRSDLSDPRASDTGTDKRSGLPTNIGARVSCGREFADSRSFPR